MFLLWGHLYLPTHALDDGDDDAEMFRVLVHDELRGPMNRDLKADTAQTKQIEEILKDPKASLSNQEKDLLWMFGYTLTTKKNSVVKFVLAVDWDLEVCVDFLCQLVA